MRSSSETVAGSALGFLPSGPPSGVDGEAARFSPELEIIGGGEPDGVGTADDFAPFELDASFSSTQTKNPPVFWSCGTSRRLQDQPMETLHNPQLDHARNWYPAELRRENPHFQQDRTSPICLNLRRHPFSQKAPSIRSRPVPDAAGQSKTEMQKSDSPSLQTQLCSIGRRPETLRQLLPRVLLPLLSLKPLRLRLLKAVKEGDLVRILPLWLSGDFPAG